jgi:hypothetical protein
MNKLKLVKFNTKGLSLEVLQIYPSDFVDGAVFALLGEIEGQEGHCVVASKRSGDVYWL